MSAFIPRAEVAHSSVEDTTDKIEIPETTEQKIERFAIKYNLDVQLMKKISWAESRYQNVPNYMYDGENGYYTAYGPFQITRTTYRAFCGEPSERLEIDKNIECAMIIASQDGVHHWNESKQAWSN